MRGMLWGHASGAYFRRMLRGHWLGVYVPFFDCCIVVVLKVLALAGNFGGAKMYFTADALRTAAEALRIMGGICCLAGVWESLTQ